MKTFPSSITIEEAVARMVNMDYIPAGFTLLEMTAAFLEEAEVEYENARIDRLPGKQITSFKKRLDACKARHELTQSLLESLQYEVKNIEESMIVLADDSSSQQRLTLESVSDWAADRYGIGIPEWGNNLAKIGLIPLHSQKEIDNMTYLQQSQLIKADTNVIDNNSISDKGTTWSDISIKIWKDHKIGVIYKSGKVNRSSFQDIGLIDKRTNKPNLHGNILILLSKKGIYPKGKIAKNNERAAISKLRHALYRLTNISDDPFCRFNPADGWKPQFGLDYDVNNADNRAKKNAKHVDIDKLRNPDKEKLVADYTDKLNDAIDRRHSSSE